jgi:hypothetical protein
MKGNGSLNPVVAGTFKACDLEFEFIVRDIENPLVVTAGIELVQGVAGTGTANKTFNKIRFSRENQVRSRRALRSYIVSPFRRV